MINIIIGKDIKPTYEGDILAVDKSAFHLIENGYKDFYAIGDFDSCTNEQFKIIESNVNAILYPSEKDYSDLELAIRYALEVLNEKEIIVHNIYCGNRLDHLYANITLLRLGLEFNANIRQVDDFNEVQIYRPGIYKIENKHKYLSLFALEDVKKLNLINFKYPLNDFDLKSSDPLCLSNEVLNESSISFDEGLILMIKSSD